MNQPKSLPTLIRQTKFQTLENSDRPLIIAGQNIGPDDLLPYLGDNKSYYLRLSFADSPYWHKIIYSPL